MGINLLINSEPKTFFILAQISWRFNTLMLFNIFLVVKPRMHHKDASVIDKRRGWPWSFLAWLTTHCATAPCIHGAMYECLLITNIIHVALHTLGGKKERFEIPSDVIKCLMLELHDIYSGN